MVLGTRLAYVLEEQICVDETMHKNKLLAAVVNTEAVQSQVGCALLYEFLS